MNRIKLFLLALPLLLVLGCKSIAPGSDPIVVRSEQTISVALDTMDLFLRLEYENPTLSKLTEVHQTAELIRRNGKAWIQSATSAVRAYKANRSPENKATLVTALAVLQAALNESQRYILRAQ